MSPAKAVSELPQSEEVQLVEKQPVKKTSPGTWITTAAGVVTNICKSPKGIEHALEGTVFLINQVVSRFTDSLVGSPSHLITGTKALLGAFSVIRVVMGLNFFFTGKFKEVWEHGAAGKIHVLAEAAFLIARVFYACVWAAEYHLITSSVEALQFSLTIGRHVFFKATFEQLCYGFFIAGMATRVVGDGSLALSKDVPKKWKHFCLYDFLNNLGEASLLYFVLAGSVSPLMGIFALVSATAGVRRYFLQRKL